jgi:molybdate transport system substrate-binding protein
VKRRCCIDVLTLIAAATVLSATAPAVAAEIKIMTARAGATVLEKIAPGFERATGHKITVVTGFGPSLAKAIDAGQPFDILIAGPPIIDRLATDGKISAGTRTILLRGGMGVEVRAGAPKPDVGSTEAFRRTLLNAKSIGYLRVNRVAEVIEKLGLTDVIAPKLVTPEADTVSELVAKGELELGIVLTSQILTTPGVDFVGPLPPELQYEFSFAAGIGSQSKDPAAAKELLDFFRTPASILVIQSQGMELG